MERKNEERTKNPVSGVDKKFQGLNHLQRAKFAIEQISLWQKKHSTSDVPAEETKQEVSFWQEKYFDEKNKIPKENIIDATPAGMIISAYPEIEA
ncbi:Uncharacterised protein [uncultured archaeon]|nr:Uncharacterised protein [uncultured archaeon]